LEPEEREDDVDPNENDNVNEPAAVSDDIVDETAGVWETTMVQLRAKTKPLEWATARPQECTPT
jgi:hypothetical protein